MAIDPLKPIRGRLEMAAAPEERLRLLVGPIAAEPLLLERTRQISGERYAMLLIDGPRLRLRGYDRVPTRSIDIDSNAPDALADLMDFLRRWPIDRIEATGLKYVARQIYSAISSLRFPIDLLVAGKADVEDISRHNENHTFDQLIPLDPMSAMLVGRTAPFEQSCAPQSQQNDGALAILLPFETPSALLLCISITKHLSRDDQQVVVLGGSIIEERLIARGLFVTGPVTVDETPEVMARYNIGRLFLPYRESHYWTLHRIRRHCFASACFFDWSEKEFPHGANGDLALSSALSDENVATAVLNWARAGSKMGAA